MQTHYRRKAVLAVMRAILPKVKDDGVADAAVAGRLARSVRQVLAPRISEAERAALASMDLLELAARVVKFARRQKWQDGRAVAVEGDRVYQRVAGFGGTAAAIQGEVVKIRGELRVRITGVAALLGLGSVAAKNTRRYGPEWTVVDDPRVDEYEATKLARAFTEKKRREAEELAERREAEARAAEAHARGEPYLRVGHGVGSRVTDHFNQRQGTIAELDGEGHPVVQWDDIDYPVTIGSPDASGRWRLMTVASLNGR